MFSFLPSFLQLQVVFATNHCDNNLFFFFPHWYKYLHLSGKLEADCSIADSFIFPGDIWLVALAILDMLLRLAGFVAVVSIIIAGVGYMASGGNPEKATAARRRIYNSLIGLAIALMATVFVAFIGNRLA